MVWFQLVSKFNCSLGAVAVDQKLWMDLVNGPRTIYK